MSHQDNVRVPVPAVRCRLGFHWGLGPRLDVGYWPWMHGEVFGAGWRRRHFAWVYVPTSAAMAMVLVPLGAVTHSPDWMFMVMLVLVVPIGGAAGGLSAEARARLLAHQGLSADGSPLAPKPPWPAWPPAPPIRGVQAVPFFCGFSVLGALGAAATLLAFVAPAGDWQIGPVGVFGYRVDHLDAILTGAALAGAALGVVGALAVRRSARVEAPAKPVAAPQSTRRALAFLAAAYGLAIVATWLGAGPVLIGAAAIAFGLMSCIIGAALAVWAHGHHHHRDVRVVGVPLLDRRAFVLVGELP